MKALGLVVVGLVSSIGCSSSRNPPPIGGFGGTPGMTGTGGSGGACASAFVHVPWEIVDNATDLPISCAAAGASDVRLVVTPIGMGYTSMAQPCPADGTSGEFHNFPANSAGGYTIDIALRDAAGMILSEFASPTLEPFCDGFWTPTVILPVNR